LAGESVRNTDNRNRLEYDAPRGLLVKGLEDENSKAVWAQRTLPLSNILWLNDTNAALQAAAETLINIDDGDADHFMSYLERAPMTAELALLRGRWHLAIARYAEAKAAFEIALRMDPKSLDAAVGLANVARRQGQYDTAELLARQVLGRDPNFIPAIQCMMRVTRARERWDESAQWQATLLKLKPDSDPDEYSRLGEVLYQAGKDDLAERAFVAALQKEPYSYAAHRNLGEIYIKKKTWDKAQAELEFVEHFHPDADASTFIRLAEIYRNTGRPQSAAEILRKGLRIFPDNIELQNLNAPPK